VAYATAPPGDAKLKAATLNFNLTGRVPLARIEDPHPAKMTAKLIAQLAAKNSYNPARIFGGDGLDLARPVSRPRFHRGRHESHFHHPAGI